MYEMLGEMVEEGVLSKLSLVCAFSRDREGCWWSTWSRCFRRSGGGSRGRDQGVKYLKKYKVDFWDLVNPQFMIIL